MQLTPPSEFLNAPAAAARGTPENQACEWLHAFARGYAMPAGGHSDPLHAGFNPDPDHLLKGHGHLNRTEVVSGSWLTLLPANLRVTVTLREKINRFGKLGNVPHWYTFTDLVSHFHSIGLLVGLDVLHEAVKDPTALSAAWTQWHLFHEWPARVTGDVLLNHANHRVGVPPWRWRHPLHPPP